MKKTITKIIASALAITMTITAIPFLSYAVDEFKAPTLGYARKSQYVLFSSGNNAMQLHAANIAINGNLYSGGNLDAYDESISVRGNVYLGGELNKHDYTIWDSYMFEDNSEERLLTDFTDAVVDSLGDNYIVHEYWQTYSNPELENEGNIYAKDGLQFTGNNVTLGGTIISDTYLLISASHALNTAFDSEMNLYVANGNIGIYAGDATINGIIYAPNGTVQICGSDVEINGMIIAKEILISAENLIINENLNLSLASYVLCYNDQILAAYADYDIEAESFTVNLISTMEGGEYSIYTSLDSDNYELNGTTTKTEYTFGIDEKVPELYIKATQTFDNGFVIVSNIIKMVYDDDYGYIMEQTDTDLEGLLDLYEHIFGSDINNVDTDGDGLSDYIEVMIIGTDPLYKDSDEDGIEDGDEDYDGDGLTNLQEIEYGTDLTLTDTDNDGLSDYDEIFIYGTDPLNPDSDGDGIKDGDEIALGLDPLSEDSDGDGVPDNEELFVQNVDNDGLTDFNSENDYTLSIEINAAGYANTSTEIIESGFSYITQTNNAVLGKVAAIEYDTVLKVGSAALKFTIPETTVNSARHYSNSAELAGINRYAVFHYNEEHNIMHPVVVVYDNATHTLTVNTDELGDYFVVDLDQWFFDMDIVPDQAESASEISTIYVETEAVGVDKVEETYEYTLEEIKKIFDFSDPLSVTSTEKTVQTIKAAAPSISAFTAIEKIEPVDVVFILDCTDNLQDNFDNVKENIISASEAIFKMCDSAKIKIIQFWASRTPEESEWYTNSQILALKEHVDSIAQTTIGNSLLGEALKTSVDLEYRTDATKFNFLIFDEYSQWAAEDTGDEAAITVQKFINKGINFSAMFNHDRTQIQFSLPKLIEQTGGDDYTNLGEFYNIIVKHIYENTNKIDDSGKPDDRDNSLIDISGHVMLGDFSDDVAQIFGEKPNYAKDYIEIGGGIDSDNDGIYDDDEVDKDNMRIISNQYRCWTYYDFQLHYYPQSMGSIMWMDSVKNVKVLPLYSSPWEKDTDYDGIEDGYDALPLNNNPLKYQKIYENIKMRNGNNHTLEFVAPQDGYYRFELYYYDNLSFGINFDNRSENGLSLSGSIWKSSKLYSDDRIYHYLNKGEKISFTVSGGKGKEYGLYITKATAYLCGGEFVELNTKADVIVLSGLFRAYGFDVIEYKGNSFSDVYKYADKKSPFGATHSEVVVISSHGETGCIKNYSNGRVYMPENENIFSQNIITLFACCYSSRNTTTQLSVVEQCRNAGAQTVIGFSHKIYNEEALYYSCKFFYKILNGEGSVITVDSDIDKGELFAPDDEQNDEDFKKYARVDLEGQTNRNWFMGLHLIDEEKNVIYSNINSILQYAKKLCIQYNK